MFWSHLSWISVFLELELSSFFWSVSGRRYTYGSDFIFQESVQKQRAWQYNGTLRMRRVFLNAVCIAQLVHHTLTFIVKQWIIEPTTRPGPLDIHGCLLIAVFCVLYLEAGHSSGALSQPYWFTVAHYNHRLAVVSHLKGSTGTLWLCMHSDKCVPVI